jgi:phospholipid/cholesterol/gamma-HCH transport system substrate-binding protein
VSAGWGSGLKFGVFTTVMALLTVALFVVFGQYRTGSTYSYSAVFNDVSGLRPGDSVRAGGLRVGTVASVDVQADNTVVTTFDADRDVRLTSGSKAAVRYLNLVGDRYLELVEGPGSIRVLPAGSQIPIQQTMPALDLDGLLGGLRPVIQGLNPQDVNALTASLLQIFQGQGGTLDSLLSNSGSFSSDLADNSQVIEQLIDNLNTVMTTLAKEGDKFSGAIDRFEQLVSGLAKDRDPIGNAIDSLSNGTASIADLLTAARPGLAGTVAQLDRLAPLLDQDKPTLETAIQKAPDNYRKLVRLGAYGAWFNYYICELSLRVSDLQGRTVVVPWVKQTTGRCAES